MLNAVLVWKKMQKKKIRRDANENLTNHVKKRSEVKMEWNGCLSILQGYLENSLLIVLGSGASLCHMDFLPWELLQRKQKVLG